MGRVRFGPLRPRRGDPSAPVVPSIQMRLPPGGRCVHNGRARCYAWPMQASWLLASHFLLGTLVGPSVGLGPTQGVGAGATSQLVAEVDAAVARALQEDGLPVSGIGLGCQDEACVLDSARAGAHGGVLTISVEEELNDYRITATLRAATSGDEVASKTVDCEICSFDEVTEASVVAAREVMEAAGSLPSGEAAPAPAMSFEGELTVSTDPPGAEVFVDGVSMGTTPFSGMIEVGTHEIELRREGYAPEVAFVEIDSEQARTLSVTLTARGGGGIWGKPWLRPASWAAVGVGAGLLISGFTLIGIDENPYKRDCSGENVDANGVCKFRYNTLGGGVALTVTGVALAAAGATMLVLDNKKSRPVSVAVGPTYLGLRGRF